jgi:hypothetical protein
VVNIVTVITIELPFWIPSILQGSNKMPICGDFCIPWASYPFEGIALPQVQNSVDRTFLSIYSATRWWSSSYRGEKAWPLKTYRSSLGHISALQQCMLPVSWQLHPYPVDKDAVLKMGTRNNWWIARFTFKHFSMSFFQNCPLNSPLPVYLDAWIILK